MKAEWSEEEREAWFVDGLDGELSPEEVSRMAQAFEADPALREQFAAYAEVTKSLQTLRTGRAPARLARQVMKRVSKAQRRQRWIQDTDLPRGTWVATAVVLCLCAAAVGWWVMSKS